MTRPEKVETSTSPSPIGADTAQGEKDKPKETSRSNTANHDGNQSADANSTLDLSDLVRDPTFSLDLRLKDPIPEVLDPGEKCTPPEQILSPWVEFALDQAEKAVFTFGPFAMGPMVLTFVGLSPATVGAVGVIAAGFAGSAVFSAAKVFADQQAKAWLQRMQPERPKAEKPTSLYCRLNPGDVKCFANFTQKK